MRHSLYYDLNIYKCLYMSRPTKTIDLVLINVSKRNMTYTAIKVNAFTKLDDNALSL